jgi:alkylation response protein AidB-like acyl-CoA dehydrogenase
VTHVTDVNPARIFSAAVGTHPVVAFDLTPTVAQHDLARRTHEFAEQVIRPVAAGYDQRQEFPWPVLEEAASQGFYSPLFYRDLIGDPTGLSLPMFMEELFWGCAGIGLAIVMPALALSAISQAASPEQMLRWAPECFGMPMVAAQALGIARAALEYATEYANRREAFGAPIIDNQGIAFPLADLATQIDAARLLTWRASWMAATGVPFDRGEGSMSKLAASEVAVRTTERAIQTMGGWGYITDHPVEKWYRDAKLYTIFEGTSEIQRMVISHALGAADGKPPMHVDLEPSGGPLNRWFGRGTPLRTRAASAALASKDRVPEPIMRLAMKVLRPPRR